MINQQGPLKQGRPGSRRRDRHSSRVGKGSPARSVTVRSRVSGTQGHCLDVPQGSGQVGQAMHLYRCNDTPAQTWDLWGPGGIIF